MHFWLRAVMQPLYDEQERVYQDYRAALAKHEQDKATHKQALRDHEDGEPLPVEPAPPP